MKLLPVVVIALLAVASAAPSRDYAIRAVPLTAVGIDDVRRDSVLRVEQPRPGRDGGLD